MCLNRLGFIDCRVNGCLVARAAGERHGRAPPSANEWADEAPERREAMGSKPIAGIDKLRWERWDAPDHPTERRKREQMQ